MRQLRQVLIGLILAVLLLVARGTYAQFAAAWDAPNDKPTAAATVPGAEQPAAKPEKKKETEDAKKEEEKKKDEEKKEEEKKEEPKPEPWHLIGNVGCTNLNVNGWFDMGGTINPANPASHYNGTLAPNDRDEWQFNQTYLVMEKRLKTDGGCWDFGGRIDFLYGTDFIYCESLGFETRPDGSLKWNASNQYGLAMPQAYIDVGNDKLDCKIGRFYTIIGYESMMAMSNFFYSMNYALRYAEPTTHTGGLFTYKLSDALSIYAGGVNGQDETDGVVDSLSVLTGFAYAPQKEKFALNFGLMTGGLGPGNVAFSGPHTYFSLYGTYNFNDKWQSVTQWDTGWQDNYDGLDENHTAVFYGLTQYVFYTINPCWKAGFRYDMFVDEQGDKLGGLRPGNPLPLPSGSAGTVHAISLGLNYTPSLNIRLRPELRCDWFNGTGPKLFDDSTANFQFTAAMDLLVIF